jgi:hypothetical protein
MSEEPRSKVPRTKEKLQKKTKEQRRNTKDQNSKGSLKFREPLEFIIWNLRWFLASWFFGSFISGILVLGSWLAATKHSFVFSMLKR